jgi:transposase
VDRGVPIFGRTLDGNSSDKTSNNHILSRISQIMGKNGLGPGAFVYVADSAMVTEKNLEAMGANRFISRLPATYGACGQAISEAVDSGSWIDLGQLAENAGTTKRPCATYKAVETSVVLYGKAYRAVVVHSSSHDKRRQKKLDKAIVESATSIKAQLSRLQTLYSCEADAQTASDQAKKFSDGLHTVTTAIHSVEIRRPGRPPSKRPTPTMTRYELCLEIVPNSVGVDRQRSLAGCFVLLSNVPTEGPGEMDAAGLLRTYKGQYGVESDFAFLKDPLVVNDLFLKTPSRIDALGMILIIALMVWRLMERTMRVYVENTKTTLPGWDNRDTDRPTSFMMTTAMTGIMVALIGGKRFMLRGPGPRQLAFLDALGLDPPVFLDPCYQCKPIIPFKLASKG